MEDIEIWKDLPQWEGFYQVSNKGRVKSLGRFILPKTRKPYWREEKILSPAPNPLGYQFVNLNKNNIAKTSRVHRLVLMAFVGMPPEGKNFCMHLDDNPTNNNLSNLKWGSASDNMKDCVQKGRHFNYWLGKKGALNQSSIKVVRICKNTGAEEIYDSVIAASEANGLVHQSISRYLLGQRKPSSGYIWKKLSDHLPTTLHAQPN